MFIEQYFTCVDDIVLYTFE